MTESPVAWRVSGVPDNDAVQPVRAQPFEMKFGTREEAEDYKVRMKAKGWVAVVTPVFVTRRTVISRNKKAQTAPFGEFHKDWRLYEK